MRTLQTSAPLLSDRTGYVIPPGPYNDDARRIAAEDVAARPFAAPEQQAATGTGFGAAGIDETSGPRTDESASGLGDEDPSRS